MRGEITAKERKVIEKTRKFYKMLLKNSKEAKERPEKLIPLEYLG